MLLLSRKLCQFPPQNNKKEASSETVGFPLEANALFMVALPNPSFLHSLMAATGKKKCVIISYFPFFIRDSEAITGGRSAEIQKWRISVYFREGKRAVVTTLAFLSRRWEHTNYRDITSFPAHLLEKRRGKFYSVQIAFLAGE